MLLINTYLEDSFLCRIQLSWTVPPATMHIVFYFFLAGWLSRWFLKLRQLWYCWFQA